MMPVRCKLKVYAKKPTYLEVPIFLSSRFPSTRSPKIIKPTNLTLNRHQQLRGNHDMDELLKYPVWWARGIRMVTWDRWT